MENEMMPLTFRVPPGWRPDYLAVWQRRARVRVRVCVCGGVKRHNQSNETRRDREKEKTKECGMTWMWWMRWMCSILVTLYAHSS